ncbi:MAG: serine hydrolase domain-containing protein [Aggregatilineales bacterium]
MKQILRLLCLVSLVFAVGMVSLAQDDSDADVSDLLGEYVEYGEPGVVVYMRLGEDEWIGVGGLANLDTEEAVMTDDLFRIASATKPFVATVVLQLAENGDIDLDAPIADYVPAEVAEGLINIDTATIRQMLQMTSGIFNYTESDAFNDAVDADPSYQWTAAETLGFVVDEDPYFEPSEGYYYSNSNYNLAQIVIETVTGNSLAVELEARIFAPVGMDACYLETPDRFAQGIVRGYQLGDGDGYEDVTEYNDGTGLGDGGIVCNATDLAKFLPALANGDLLGEAMLAEMLNTVDDGEGGAYGLGIGYDESDYGTMVGHDGASSGFQSSMVYFPDDDAVVIVLTNNMDSEIIEDIAYDAIDYLLGEG